VENLEKRNIELKLQLKKSGVELDESSQRKESHTVETTTKIITSSSHAEN